MLRVWGVDGPTATQALTDLVAQGLAAKFGGRRSAQYELLTVPHRQEPSEDEPPERTGLTRTVSDTQLAAVVEAIRAGHTTSRAIASQLGLSYPTTLRRIKALREAGRIEETANRYNRSQSYRLPTAD